MFARGIFVPPDSVHFGKNFGRFFARMYSEGQPEVLMSKHIPRLPLSKTVTRSYLGSDSNVTFSIVDTHVFKSKPKEYRVKIKLKV